MGAVGLKTHIWNNDLRSTFLLIGFPVLLLLFIYAAQLVLMAYGFLPNSGTLGGDFALSAQMLLRSAPLAFIAAAVWFAIAYFANTKIIAVATGAKAVTRAEEPKLYNMLENLAISRGLKTPRLNIIESPTLNAFASGLNQNQYTVTVTRGLMEQLTDDELEAVLAHELTHVINHDVRTMVVASIFAGIITVLAELFFRFLLRSGVRRSRSSGKGGGAAAIIVLVVAVVIAAIGYLLAIVIRMSLSRSREFVADAGAVELTKNPDAMISALRKVAGSEELGGPEQLRGMYFQNKEAGFNALFASHPPIEKRIDALVKFAGGRDAPAEMLEPEQPQAGPWS